MMCLCHNMWFCEIVRKYIRKAEPRTINPQGLNWLLLVHQKIVCRLVNKFGLCTVVSAECYERFHLLANLS